MTENKSIFIDQGGKRFHTHSKDGSPKECKFCHKAVWWHCLEGRWYDPGGDVLHVETCPRSKAHYKGEALDRQETKRQER